MPRGSKPGERRGGRQRGTPNKSTVLKNAVLCATAANSSSSPLDFLLGLMRDPQVPTDLRIEMAARAARFVHIPPRSPARKRTPATEAGAGIKIGRSNTLPNFNAPKVDATLSAAAPGVADSADLAPLDFLLSVMSDPEAAPQQRIRAARAAAPNLHTHPHPDQMPIVIEDPFGFDIDPAAARALRDDERRADRLREATASDERSYSAETLDRLNAEKRELQARIAERVKLLRCPSVYGEREAKKDEGRLRALPSKRDEFTAEEDAEEAHLMARLAAYRASPEGQARARIAQLGNQWRIKPLGGRALTPEEQSAAEQSAAEQSELGALRARYPDLPDDRDPLDYSPDPMQKSIDAWNKAARGDRRDQDMPNDPDPPGDADLLKGSDSPRHPDSNPKSQSSTPTISDDALDRLLEEFREKEWEKRNRI